MREAEAPALHQLYTLCCHQILVVVEDLAEAEAEAAIPQQPRLLQYKAVAAEGPLHTLEGEGHLVQTRHLEDSHLEVVEDLEAEAPAEEQRGRVHL